VEPAISIEKFSELVDVIYAAALDPSEWTQFGRLLTEATGSALAGIGVLDLPSSRFTQTYGYGLPGDYSNASTPSESLTRCCPTRR
jgi:hypothetical protein